MRAFLAISIIAATIAVCASTTVSDTEWNNYKILYKKSYPTTADQNNARYYYAVNKQKILNHNTRYTNNQESYNLAVNQFTDMKFLTFAALFPPTTEIPSNASPYTLPTATPPESFSYAAQGFNSVVQDQGIVCNSGWAYSSAAAIQIFDAVISGSTTSATLSAQNLIDCAGSMKSCNNQVSQVAFDYLTQYGQKLNTLAEYPNMPDSGQGMCVPPASSLNAKGLTSYATIANGNDVALKSIVNFVAPVVVKFNPGTFEFMHYKEGVFTQPAPTQTAAHYMTVVGYGRDTAVNKDYWYLMNSFGTTWGENGFIRIARDTAKPITNSAIFPTA